VAGSAVDPSASAALVSALPNDTFAQVCGRGGLVVEMRQQPGAAIWRGHPWGTGWCGGGERSALERLLQQMHPPELTVPAEIGLPPTYEQRWAWGWHATTEAPPVQPGEEDVGWLVENSELADLLARAFPDAETPPGDPRAAAWFGARAGGVLIAAGAALRASPGAALLSSLTVDPSARRRGWGRALTAWFTRERLGGGAQVVGLGTYLKNMPARALYTRLGVRDVPYLGGARLD
jgi:ribosomal protein S18 acetylase RimI-like enzyme